VNRAIRRLGIALLACYLALFVQLNVVQVLRADELNAHPENTRRIQREFNEPRGDIVTADGVLVATSEDVDDGSGFDRRRTYPEGELFGHSTGYFSFLYGATGLERAYNDELAGNTLTQQLRGLTSLFVEREEVGNLRLSLRADLQRLARDQLGGRQGSVVALDPRTGELLAFWSYPSFDPNAISGLDFTAAEASFDLLDAAPGKPLLAHHYQERYFPGSTFKVVTAGNGLAADVVTADSPVYPRESSWTPPQTTQPLSNFGGSVCGGDLVEILMVSCNTAFARMGVETIGPDGMVSGSEAWGFNDAPDIDLPDPARSVFPTDFTEDLPKLAQASIGQNDVAATPLQMAMVAAAVANGGEMMAPRAVAEVVDSDGEVIDAVDPRVWRTPLDADDAAVLRDAMVQVVSGPQGTARVLAVPGMEVGGKTGTAQLGTEPPTSHTWMIGFAGPPGDPQVAVAVVVLDQPGASEFTGGQVAGPIAKAMIDAVLAIRSAEGGRRDPVPGSGVPAPSTTAGPTTTGGAPASTTSTAGAPSTTASTSPPTTEASTTTTAESVPAEPGPGADP
jgi:peptidoglycan glycosyltransferase